MISISLMIYCLITGVVYLLLISIILELIRKKWGFTGNISPLFLEDTGWSWFIVNFLMEFLFFIIIPTIGYSLFYLVIPFTGVRAGMAVALMALTIGAVPITMALSVRFKLPISYLMFILLSYFLKISGGLIIISYLYSL